MIEYKSQLVYEPFQTNIVTVTFRNKDKIPRLIRVECKNSRYFSLVDGPCHSQYQYLKNQFLSAKFRN